MKPVLSWNQPLRVVSAPVSKQPNGITCESYGSQLQEICSVGCDQSHKGPPRRRRAASEVSSNHQPNPTTSPPRSQSNRMGSFVKAMGHSCRKSAVLVVIQVTKGRHDDAAQPGSKLTTNTTTPATTSTDPIEQERKTVAQTSAPYH